MLNITKGKIDRALKVVAYGSEYRQDDLCRRVPGTALH